LRVVRKPPRTCRSRDASCRSLGAAMSAILVVFNGRRLLRDDDVEDDE
jgi:hypothetical protein